MGVDARDVVDAWLGLPGTKLLNVEARAQLEGLIAAAIARDVERLRALREAAEEYGRYDDLRGDLCEHCKPAEPEAFLAAREALADALDLLDAQDAAAPEETP